MADEYIDIVNSNNQITGIRKKKSEVHKIGLWHRTIHVWINNDKGEVLLQLRAKEKSLYPNKWDISVAGHIAAGEDPVDAAIREIEEEIGLTAEPSELEFQEVVKRDTSYKDIIDKEYNYIFFLKFNGDVSELRLHRKEVAMVKFLPIRRLMESIKSTPHLYAPHGIYWHRIIDMLI